MRSPASDVSFGRQVLRRHVNVRFSEVAPAGAQAIDVLCECGGRGCADRVRISADAFSAALREGRYIVTAAHAGARTQIAREGYALVDGGSTP